MESWCTMTVCQRDTIYNFRVHVWNCESRAVGEGSWRHMGWTGRDAACETWPTSSRREQSGSIPWINIFQNLSTDGIFCYILPVDVFRSFWGGEHFKTTKHVCQRTKKSTLLFFSPARNVDVLFHQHKDAQIFHCLSQGCQGVWLVQTCRVYIAQLELWIECKSLYWP